MCGIAGAIGPKGTNLSDFVSQIVESQLSRGPDNQAVVAVQEQVCFGHDRLAIVDVSSASNQPMWSADKTLCMTFNGEIYNFHEVRDDLISLGHQFNTSGDVEVLLSAWQEWGPECLSRLNGMFAFAMYSAVEKAVYLVRDRFGVKPLYWAGRGELLLFASSTRCIGEMLGLKPNLTYLAKGIQKWEFEDHTSITPYVGLESLEAGHFVRIDLSQPREARSVPYYDLAQRVASRVDQIQGQSEKVLLDSLMENIERATRIRLRADVSIGISLSGGLDSSTLAAISSEMHPEIVGFTYGNPNKSVSEGPLVAELVAKTGIKVHYIDPDIAALKTALPDVIQAQDAPFAGPSILAQYLVYEKVKAEGVKVLLGGQGGDEALMGYRKYHLQSLKDQLAARHFPAAFQTIFQLIPVAWSERSEWGQYLGAHRRGQELAKTHLNLPAAQLGTLPFSNARERQIVDVRQTSLPTLLRYEDRNSMAHSVESRLPFMDFELVELGIALPAALKLRQGYGKFAVRELMKGRIPDSIRIAKYKRGFNVTGNWFANGLGENIRGILQEQSERTREFFTGDVHAIFTDHALENNATVFTEAMTLLWLGQISKKPETLLQEKTVSSVN